MIDICPWFIPQIWINMITIKTFYGKNSLEYIE